MYKLLSCRGKLRACVFNPISNLNVHILLFITGPWKTRVLLRISRNERHLIYALADALIHISHRFIPVRRAYSERRFKLGSLSFSARNVSIPFVCRSRLLLDLCNMRFRVNIFVERANRVTHLSNYRNSNK